MHVAAKLTIFQGISVQEEHLLSSPFFYNAPFARNRVGQTNFGNYMCVFIHTQTHTHGETETQAGMRIGMETTERKYSIF